MGVGQPKPRFAFDKRRYQLYDENRATLIFLLSLTAAALYLCCVLLSPFLKPIVFSAVLAVLFFPLHCRIAMARPRGPLKVQSAE